MSTWLSQVLQQPPLEDGLVSQRARAREALSVARWPGRKVEDWRYTPVRALEKSAFNLAAMPAEPVAAIDGLETLDIVLRHGMPLLPAVLPEGLSISLLSESKEAVSLFGSVKPERHLFGLVNDVLANTGVYIEVADGADIQQPLRLVYQAGAGEQVQQRVLIKLGAGAKATVIEQSNTQLESFTCAYAEYCLQESAQLEHYRFVQNGSPALHIGGCHFSLADKCELNSTLVGFGSELSRLDVDVIHAGQFATATMNAIYLLDGNELFDLHTTIEHASPNGTTEENVRGIVADKARAVFNGRIHIHRDAQKTLAELNNRNLLLSDGAEVNTKPELEIYADDVRCAHGATIAETDKQALYYLQSRGISKSQAQIMLNFGFINELVDAMPNAVLAEWLRPQLRDRFARMETR